jgi:hypothetical protein
MTRKAEFSIDDVGEALKPSEKLYLLRAPMGFDWLSLNGQKLDLSSNQQKVGRGATARKEGLEQQQSMRAIVVDPLVNQPSLAPRFAGCISIQQELLSSDTETADLPIPLNAYRKVPQIQGLKLRSMPRGSTTPLESVWAKDSFGSTATTKTNEEEKDEKKSKKSSKKSSKKRNREDE